jgi:hypothetical protein
MDKNRQADSPPVPDAVDDWCAILENALQMQAAWVLAGGTPETFGPAHRYLSAALRSASEAPGNALLIAWLLQAPQFDGEPTRITMTEAHEYMSIADAARLLSISARTLRYWATTGKLPTIQGDRGRLVRLDDVRKVVTHAGRAPEIPNVEVPSSPQDDGTMAFLSRDMSGVDDGLIIQIRQLKLLIGDRDDDIARLTSIRDQLLAACAEAEDRLRLAVTATALAQTPSATFSGRLLHPRWRPWRRWPQRWATSKRLSNRD